jgi:uncharacterized membrane protein YcaP (DUF421 family)
MLERIWAAVEWALGLGLDNMVFIIATAMIRLGNKRFMGKNTALDVMLGIVFGSVVSRAITGNAPFFPTLAAGLVLVVAHWVLSAIAFRSHRFGEMVKGRSYPLVVDGRFSGMP